MKKINLFALLAMLFSVSLFVSCSSDDEETKDDGADKYGQTIEVGNFEGKYRMVSGEPGSFVPLDDDWYGIKVNGDDVTFNNQLDKPAQVRSKSDIKFYSWGCVIPEPSIRGSVIAEIQYPEK